MWIFFGLLVLPCHTNAANWDVNMGSGGAPQLKGPRRFSFDEIRNYTNNFSEANGIGSGGYGKVAFDCLSS
jgi:hypothetical protein